MRALTMAMTVSSRSRTTKVNGKSLATVIRAAVRAMPFSTVKVLDGLFGSDCSSSSDEDTLSQEGNLNEFYGLLTEFSVLASSETQFI